MMEVREKDPEHLRRGGVNKIETLVVAPSMEVLAPECIELALQHTLAEAGVSGWSAPPVWSGEL